MEEILTSAFGCFYFQEPSFLQYQSKMKEGTSRSNITSILGINNISKETQIRDVLDRVDFHELDAIPKEFISRLQRGNELKNYEFVENKYLLPLDGTQYFSSENIHCSSCLQKKLSNGKVHYSHQALQATIVHPDNKQVLPIMAEEISNQDGQVKQDCELNAGKRLLKRLKSSYPKLKFVINGDDLYGKEPFIKQVKENDWDYIFTAKEPSHKTLYKYIQSNMKELHTLSEIGEDSKKTFIYEWMEDVPLTMEKDMEITNYISLKIIDKKGKITYSSAWITSLPLSEDMIKHYVKGARARWKIENECFNNLKNRGYHLEHNFGHGEKLSFVLYTLLIFAFFMHEILAITDLLYREILAKYNRKKLVWQKIIFSVNMIYFDSWRELLFFVLTPDRYKMVPT